MLEKVEGDVRLRLGYTVLLLVRSAGSAAGLSWLLARSLENAS
jgi:hypothetical protein